MAVLKDYHKDFICTQIAEYKSHKEIEEAFKEKYTLTIWPQQIVRIKKKQRDFIDKVRVRYLKDMGDIPIAQKRIRLERTEDQYELAQNIENAKDKIKANLSILARAQEEVEGKTKLGDTIMNFQQNNMYNDYSDAELIKLHKDLQNKIKKFKVPKDVIEVGDK